MEYWRHLNKIKKDYKQYGLDENLDVREAELKNWIKNMDYEKIQENIENGRIKKLNYAKSVQEDLLYCQKIGKIRLDKNQK